MFLRQWRSSPSALTLQSQSGIRCWGRCNPTTRLSVLDKRSFSGLGPRSSASSILNRAGLSPEWLRKQRLILKDDDGKLYSKRLTARTQEIRLLFILPDKDNESEIELLLAHGSLDDPLAYLALSYTHGNPLPDDSHKNYKSTFEENPYHERKNVFINGIEYPITLNLFHALRRFRTMQPKRPLWVDALCINQSDPIERSGQVRMMGEIYRRAEEVLIWLGEIENTVETEMALEVVKNIFRAFACWYDSSHSVEFRHRWNHFSRTTETTPDSIAQRELWTWLHSDFESWANGLDLRKRCGRSDERPWRALGNFLSRSWFDRAWTWQEKELAKRATVFIGDKSIPWAELRLSMLAIMAHDQSGTHATPSQVMPGQEYLRVLDSLNSVDFPDLLDVVIKVRHRKSHLERDKIFAVLGAADRSSLDVRYFYEMVNYGDLSIRELYKEFARYWIEDKSDLRVLQACNPARAKLQGLPTWVADWSDIVPSHQQSTNLYRAGKDTRVEVEFHYHKNSDEIRLRGIPIDKIKTVCQDPWLDNLEEKLIDESAYWDPFREQLLQPFAAMYISGYRYRERRIFPILEGNWLAAARQIRWDETYKPTGESMGEAYWRTLLMDHNPHAKGLSNQRIPADIDVCAIFDSLAQRWTQTRSLYSPRWSERLQSTVKYKRFFMTETGLIGMASSKAKPGDVVCVLFGGRVPFSLRKVEDHYNLVGETYVHGFMDGRAVDLANRSELETVDFCIR